MLKKSEALFLIFEIFRIQNNCFQLLAFQNSKTIYRKKEPLNFSFFLIRIILLNSGRPEVGNNFLYPFLIPEI